MSRDARSDPFTPGFGNLPKVFVGRATEMNDLTGMVERLADGIYEQPRLVTGDRGMGKTSLLLQFEQEQAEAGRWMVRAAATRDHAIVSRICRGVAEYVHSERLFGKLADAVRAGVDRLAGVTISSTGVTVDLGRQPAGAPDGDTLRSLLEAAARLAREQGTVLALLVDEAQNIHLDTLGQLFYAIQEVQGVTIVERDAQTGALRRDALPLAVVVAGLPGLVDRLKRAGSTFGERSKPLRLAALPPSETVAALREFAREGGAAFDADAAELVAHACGGYPYFLHVVGSHVWRAGTSEVITTDDARAGIAAARPYLEAFYEQRLTEVGDLQRRYLKVAAQLDEAQRTPGGVARALGRTSDQLGSTLAALVERHGLLRNDGRGRLVFTLPGLDGHLRG